MTHNAPSATDSRPTSIRVTVDKSHIITIGERLYTESIELVRELVNNAYDADATRVDVGITAEEIVIRDNGTGMDLKGLRQYFAIGSTEKKLRSKSPVYHRDRIGQFGIGKFASLMACRQFEVVTQRGEFRAHVLFDKDEWERSPTSWELPLEIQTANPDAQNGTTIILRNLIHAFDVDEVRRRLTESVPLKAPDFEVLLNGQKISPRLYTGQRIGIMEGTPHGPIFGEIVILPISQIFDDDCGIEIKVKQVTVCRDFFGLDRTSEMRDRLRGEVHADFLPVTSDRSGFVRDSPEYIAFQEAMGRVAAEVGRIFSHLSGKQEKRRASRALNEAMQRITQALMRNPDFAPFGMMPTGDSPASSKSHPNGVTPYQPDSSPVEKKPRKKKIAVKKLTPDAVVKRMRLGSSKVACCLDHFGNDGPECQSRGNVIYINMDHPLYGRASVSPITYTWHLARLLAQEITMMKSPSTAKQAFQRQSLILKGAFAESSHLISSPPPAPMTHEPLAQMADKGQVREGES